MPSKESFGVQNLWWSMEYCNVHWIQINTETDYPNSPMGPGTFYNAGPFGEQMVWLLNDLQKAAANRANVPWIIVSGHRPLYSSGHENKNVIAAFETLLLKFNVDIFFAGHVHWSVCFATTARHYTPLSLGRGGLPIFGCSFCLLCCAFQVRAHLAAAEGRSCHRKQLHPTAGHCAHHQRCRRKH